MRRALHCNVKLVVMVDFPIKDEEQITADPEGLMSDGEAAHSAIVSAVGQYHSIYVFGIDQEPVTVYIDSYDVKVDGEW